MLPLPAILCLVAVATSPTIAGSGARTMHLVGEDELESAGAPPDPNEFRRPLDERISPQAAAHLQLARVQRLLEQRRELLDGKPGFAGPIGMLVGSVVAVPVAVVLLSQLGQFLPYVPALFSGGVMGVFLGVIVVLGVVVGVAAGVLHFVLGGLFGPALGQRVKARDDVDRRARALDAEIEEESRKAEAAEAAGTP